MDVIGHQAIGPTFHAICLAALGHEIKVKRIVLIAQEKRLPPVAALRNMVREIGNRDAREPSHGLGLYGINRIYAIGIMSP
jgi:hypothetical protein